MNLINLFYQADPTAFIIMVVAFTGVLAINLYQANVHLLPVWLVTNAWHYLKPRPWEGSRTEIRELKVILKDKQQGRW